MSPEVLARKLRRLRGYLVDLERHRGRSADELLADPYEVERLIELVVQVSVDVLSHQLSDRGVSPASYRATFELAGREGVDPGGFGATARRSCGPPQYPRASLRGDRL